MGRHKEPDRASPRVSLNLRKEIACIRALLERILRVIDEGLFVDYQMEKFGLIKYEVEKG